MFKNSRHSLSSKSICPCNSEKLFSECCSKVINNQALALTPEVLMRSRYTAFVIENSDYLLQSWHFSTRPKTLTFEKHIIWLKLIIEKAPLPLPSDNIGYVSFCAQCIQNDNMIKITEKSTFIRKANLWFYRDGELATQETPLSLNGLCACGSGKKYKRCCKI